MANTQLSQRTRNLHPSPIREILAVIDRPGMISFAGGLPAAEVFPEITPAEVPSRFLQYGPTEGETELRARVAAELERLGLRCSAEQVLILSGSQQGIDLVAKLFIDEGTPVAVESPTYLAALQVFRYFGARFVGVAQSDEMDRGECPAFAYVVPTFQNPTGRCYSTDERRALARYCDTHGVPLFEDDPYRDLVYEACDRVPICSRLTQAPWVYQGSFSKSFAPGLRLGYLAASRELIPLLTRLKQAADLHSNRLSQWLVLQHLDDPARAERSGRLAAFYRAKRDAFARALDRHFGGIAHWRQPPGGLFLWLTLTRPVDTRTLLPSALARGVAFMPGEAFFVRPDEGLGTLRLNFSQATTDQAEQGLATLADLLR